MNITTGNRGQIIIEKVFETLEFITEEGEVLLLSMRDNGFELSYSIDCDTPFQSIKLNEGNIDIIDIPENKKKDNRCEKFMGVLGRSIERNQSLGNTQLAETYDIIRSIFILLFEDELA